MRLTEEDKKKFTGFLEEKCGGLKCTCCGVANWAIHDQCNLALGYDLHTTRFHYHEGTLILTLICTNCGHMLMFNPGVIGFRPDEPEKHEVTDPEETK